MAEKGVIYILTNPSFPQYVKIGYADNVESRYESDPSKLVSDIKAKPGALVDKSYEESWVYIKSGNCSLEPHTNINILFDRLMEEPEE